MAPVHLWIAAAALLMAVVAAVLFSAWFGQESPLPERHCPQHGPYYAEDYGCPVCQRLERRTA